MLVISFENFVTNRLETRYVIHAAKNAKKLGVGKYKIYHIYDTIILKYISGNANIYLAFIYCSHIFTVNWGDLGHKFGPPYLSEK